MVLLRSGAETGALTGSLGCFLTELVFSCPAGDVKDPTEQESFERAVVGVLLDDIGTV